METSESVFRGEAYPRIVLPEQQDLNMNKYPSSCTPVRVTNTQDASNYVDRVTSGTAEIGFQFEAFPVQLDMMESVMGFEESRTHSSSGNVNATNDKNEYMVKILALSATDALVFLEVYHAYEAELEKIVRSVDQAVTAAQRQAILKEEYFDTLNKAGSTYLAYRFLAWVDYYAQTCSSQD